MNGKNMLKTYVYILALCLLTGCASLFEGDEPLPLYTLKPCPGVSRGVMATPLRVDLPLSDLSLDTQRIAVTPSPYQRDYIAGGQWPDRLSQVMQDVFIETFTQRWGGEKVHRNGAGLAAERLLQTEIQDFSVYHLGSSGPSIHIKILFKLIDFRARRVMASEVFSEKVPLSSETLYGIVEAFNKGTNALLIKAMRWIEMETLHLSSSKGSVHRR